MNDRSARRTLEGLAPRLGTPFLRLAATFASLALGLAACGGMAEGEVPGGGGAESERPESPPGGGASASGPARPARGGGGSTPTPSSEECYSPSEVEEQLEDVLRFVPDDVFDDNGCVIPEYSSWLLSGDCAIATERASFRGGQCCYALNGEAAECRVR